MARLVTDVGSSFGREVAADEPSGLAGALSSFETLRAELAEQAATRWRLKRAPSQVGSAHEMAMMAELSGIHDAIAEVEQLRIYRFYLSAVNRNAVVAHRFDTQLIACTERAAAMDAQLRELTNDLNDIIEDVARYLAPKDPSEARLQVATFLWCMTWWLHARVDVAIYKFNRNDDPLTLLLMGREPEFGDAVVGPMYRCATEAELAYRNMLLAKA